MTPQEFKNFLGKLGIDTIITGDYETYWSDDYTLSRMTTEEYIRNPQFQMQAFCCLINNTSMYFCQGEDEAVHYRLNHYHNSCFIAHNNYFDGAIAHWHHGYVPKLYIDTLSMSRAVHGIDIGASLAKVAKFYDLPEKRSWQFNTKNIRELTHAQQRELNEYCAHDTWLCQQIFFKLLPYFTWQDLIMVDTVIRMFTVPLLEGDVPLLKEYLIELEQNKIDVMDVLGIHPDRREDFKKALGSANKFASILINLGIEPPTKINKNGEVKWAFAKTDPWIKDAQESEDHTLAALVNLKLKQSSNIEQNRAKRFLEISQRGAIPMPIRCYSTGTTRFSGFDKINPQNLSSTSRGSKASKLRYAIRAPDEYRIIAPDWSQMHARIAPWLCGEEKLLALFRDYDAGHFDDPYMHLGTTYFNQFANLVSNPKALRFLYKTIVLSFQFQVGAAKLMYTCRTLGGFELPAQYAEVAVKTYRQTMWKVPQGWQYCSKLVAAMVNNEEGWAFGPGGVAKVIGQTIVLPENVILKYPEIHLDHESKEFRYKFRGGWAKIYGGKLLEHITQGLEVAIMKRAMVLLRLAGFTIPLQLHDQFALLAKVDQANTVRKQALQIMRNIPEWAEGLPMNADCGEPAITFGDAK